VKSLRDINTYLTKELTSPTSWIGYWLPLSIIIYNDPAYGWILWRVPTELVIWLDALESTSQDVNGRKQLPWSPNIEKAWIIICLTISEVRTNESPTTKDKKLIIAW
jgi:hypothetical protein